MPNNIKLLFVTFCLLCLVLGTLWIRTGCVHSAGQISAAPTSARYCTCISGWYTSFSYPFKPPRCIKASFYITVYRLFRTTRGFIIKISLKLFYQYMAIFFNLPPTSGHLHSLQVENCGSNSRLVVDEMTAVNSGSKGLILLYISLYCFNPFSAGTFFRRQYLTSEDGPRTERIKTFIMAADP